MVGHAFACVLKMTPTPPPPVSEVPPMVVTIPMGGGGTGEGTRGEVGRLCPGAVGGGVRDGVGGVGFGDAFPLSPPFPPPVPLAQVYLGGCVLGWKGEGGGGEVMVPAKGFGDAEEMML